MSQRHVFIRRAAVTVGVLGGVVLGSANVASGGEPVNQACVGQSFRVLATTILPSGGVGAGVSGLARNPNLPPPGFADDIHALQAGLVPDAAVPNTCNDPD